MPESTNPVPGTDTRATLLIVDDQPENLMVLSGLLQPRYRVRVARSGAQALRTAAAEPRPDLILLDIMMPEMDGYAVLTKLRDDPVTQAIPVIFVTAMGAESDERHGLELGAADYITKPIKAEIVLARVAVQLELKAARSRLESRVAERTQALKQALDEVESAHSKLKKTYFGTLLAMNELAGLRGGAIGEHGRRVADLARLVAQRLAMSADETQDVFVAALLHDIGKIGFPDALLDKPVSAMNRDQLAIYRRHPVLGEAAIMKIEAMSDIAGIIRGHHEHYDGSGFPDGRSALDIPLGARIIGAISDYDDLKNGTLTAQAMSAKQSFQYLLGEQGSRYDPQVIAALEPLLSSADQFKIDEIMVTAPHLHEGMRLSRDVIHPNGFVLLSKGSVLSHRLIEQLVAVERQSGVTLKLFVEREPEEKSKP